MPVEDRALLDSCLHDAVTALRADSADNKSDRCQHFYQVVLPLAFEKLMTEKAVRGWNHNTQQNVFARTEQFLQFFAEKLQLNGNLSGEPAGWNGCFESLSHAFKMCLDAENQFHQKNACNSSYYQPGDASVWATPLHRPHDPAKPGYIWLADLLDSFGVARGFNSLRSAIIDSHEVTGVQMAALIRPFGGKVARMLSQQTIMDVFVPVRDKLITYLEQLPEPKFKLEKYDPAISQALRALKDLERSRGMMPVEAGQMIDGFRLKMCMKLLSCTTFDRQMNGLGEIALLINEASAVNENAGQMAWLTGAKLAEWLHTHKVLQKLLGMNLHHQAYVDKLVVIIRFFSKVGALQPATLDQIWAAAEGKHETIVANIHKLLSEIAPELDSVQLDHLFQLLEKGAAGLQPREFQRLLELVRTIGEKVHSNGSTREKVLSFLWKAGCSEQLPERLCKDALEMMSTLLHLMGQRLHEQWQDDCKARRTRQEHRMGAGQRAEDASPQPIIGPGPRPPNDAPPARAPPAQGSQESDTNSAAAATNIDAAAVSPTPSSSSVSPTSADVEDLTDDAGDPPPPQDPRTHYLQTCRRLLVQAVGDRQGRDVVPAVKLITNLLLRGSASEWRDGSMTKAERNLLGKELLEASLLYAPSERSRRATPVSTAITRWGLEECLRAPLSMMRVMISGWSISIPLPLAAALWDGLLGPAIAFSPPGTTTVTEDQKVAASEAEKEIRVAATIATREVFNHVESFFGAAQNEHRQWVTNFERRSGGLVSAEHTVAFFGEHVCRLSQAKFSPVLQLVWPTFEQWFLRANMLEGTLVGCEHMRQEGGMFTASLDMVMKNPESLLGLEELWSFVLAAHPPTTPQQQQQQQQPWQHLLVYLHSRTCMSDEMKPHTANIARKFIDDCMRRMQAAAGDVNSDTNPRGAETDEAEQRISRVLDLLRFYNNYNEGKAAGQVGHLRRRPAAVTAWRPRPLVLKAAFTPSGATQARRFPLVAFSTMTLPQLRERAVQLLFSGVNKDGSAKQLPNVTLRVQAKLNRSAELSTLYNNILTLEQLGICDQQAIYIQTVENWSLGPNGQPALELSRRQPEYLEKEAEDSLPSVLLATTSTIRELLQLGALPCAARIRKKVFYLLRDIPYSAETAQALLAITEAQCGASEAPAEEAASRHASLDVAQEALQMLLPTSAVDARCASLPLRTHYFLESIAGAAWGMSARADPNHGPSPDLLFRQNFVRAGGAAELARLLQESLGAATAAVAAASKSVQANGKWVMAPEDVDTLRGCFSAGIAIARNLIAPHVDEYGAYGNRAGDPNRGFTLGNMPKVVLSNDVRAMVAQSTEENVARMEPGVDFWQQLSYYVAWCAAAGRADLLGTAMQSIGNTEKDLTALWAVEIDADSVTKDDDDLSCDALELLQKCVGLRYELYNKAQTKTIEAQEHNNSNGGFISGLLQIRGGLIDLLLRSPKGRTRRATSALLNEALKGQERADFLNALLEALPVAETAGCVANCSQYFELLLALLEEEREASLSAGNLASKEQGQPDQRMDKLLRHSVGWLLAVEPNSSTVPQELLAGHLGLTRVLLQLPCLDDGMKTRAGVAWETANEPVKAPVDSAVMAAEEARPRGLVHQILDVFLFPAYRLISAARAASGSASGCDSMPQGAKKRRLTGGFSGNNNVGTVQADDTEMAVEQPELSSPGRERAVEPEPACRSTASRDAAERLLLSLCTGSPQNFSLTCRTLQQIHGCTSGANGSTVDSAVSADTGRRADVGFVGLKNLGATCYMNAVMQNLFMQPCIREVVLRATPSSEELTSAKPEDSAFFQVQRLFTYLNHSTLEYYNPLGFCKAFKDYDGQPIPLHEHQDGFEFFNRLVDQIDDDLAARQEPKVLSRTMGGTFAQQITTKTGTVLSETEQTFTAVSLTVREEHNLEQSLRSYIKGDLLEGENAYFSEKENCKVDAIKRTCIGKLGRMLVVHLQRFEYNWEVGNRFKLNDRFEFPEEFDMQPYTAAGLRVLDGMSAEDAGLKPKEYYRYKLAGVLVHSGTADAGHYYTYVKRRQYDTREGGRQGAAGGGFFSFDDTRVEGYDLSSNMENDCFGGKAFHTQWDPNKRQNVNREYSRVNSAYMLMYERDWVGDAEAEHEDDKQTRLKAAAKGAEQAAAKSTASEEMDARAAGSVENANVSDVVSTAAAPDTAEDQGAAASSESSSNAATVATAEGATIVGPDVLSAEVTAQNLQFRHDQQVLNGAHFTFIRRLTTANNPIPKRQKLTKAAADASRDKSDAEGDAARGDVAEEVASTASDTLPVSERDEKLAVQSMELALEFVCRMLLRGRVAGSSRSKEIAAWKPTIVHLGRCPDSANVLLNGFAGGDLCSVLLGSNEEGAELIKTALAQVLSQRKWTVVPASSGDGGHAVQLVRSHCDIVRDVVRKAVSLLRDHAEEAPEKRGTRTGELRRVGNICEVLFAVVSNVEPGSRGWEILWEQQLLQQLLNCFLMSVRKEEEVERQAGAAANGGNGPHHRKTQRAIKRSLTGVHTPARIPPYDTTHLHKTILLLLKGVIVEPLSGSHERSGGDFRSPLHFAENLCRSVARPHPEAAVEAEAADAAQLDLANALPHYARTLAQYIGRHDGSCPLAEVHDLTEILNLCLWENHDLSVEITLLLTRQVMHVCFVSVLLGS